MTVIATIEDLRVLAEKRVPRMFYEYVDSGSWSESTYRANTEDFGHMKFRQRVAVNVERRNLKTRMAGQEVTMPLAIAPTGIAGMQRADGEILGARAAEKFGIPFVLSTMSVCSIEDIAEHTSAPFWFQLYVMRDRHFMVRLIDRAAAAKCAALVVTVDLQFHGVRLKEIRNGLSVPPKMTVSNLVSLLSKPRWCLDMAGTKRRTFGNIVGHAANVKDITSMSSWVSQQFDPTLSWDDVKWIRRRWPGKLIIKGIMCAEDARLAVDSGADAVVVSNHGGRQMDHAPSTIAALPAVVDAVGGETEVHIDGGIRSGQDLLKALALGAKAGYIGRSFLYGLAARGESGVTRCLEIIRQDLDLTLAFVGLDDVKAVDSSILVAGTY
ncbi:alpha-hydroxy acid oxidase [Paraburkholderia kirstenboschensis]|uniref:Alpha-hydroxy acid oxidase n=1 Tax=Paraburkholderia kirstenboschensis TaxID=1245436 RepID=A0ABZ0EBN7_9BURK|nr:alpha-hydroxy acid oxidase [Paraburkholderia kirstenboschensis]WOD14626.1 alpha-hydroxy acid oxidase [Paraburkholderia kirstenboschensis]